MQNRDIDWCVAGIGLRRRSSSLRGRAEAMAAHARTQRTSTTAGVLACVDTSAK